MSGLPAACSDFLLCANITFFGILYFVALGNRFNNAMIKEKLQCKQECIPVGYVLPASLAISGVVGLERGVSARVGVTAPRDVCLEVSGCLCKGGVCLG